MRPLSKLTALALLLGLVGQADAVVVGGKKAKKGNHPVRGKVVAVQTDGAKGTGTITIQVHHGKKGAASTAAPVEKTFKVTSATKFQTVQGKKGAAEQKDATFAALQKGARVLINHHGDQATDVKMVVKGKGKKAST